LSPQSDDLADGLLLGRVRDELAAVGEAKKP
jgi:hypothetical protein